MTSWTSGYVTDITYTHGYYNELNPLRYQLALLSAGLIAPKTSTVCELGFGQGVSATMHAAAQAGASYWGTDFNPAQAAHARSLAEVSGADCHLFDQSFQEFCQRDDLPEFDFISLHGIWSWISDENRQIIVDFIRKKLRVGGVLYISYNTQPGWAAAVPMRHLLTQHAEKMGASGQGILNRVNGSLEFFKKFMAVNPAYIRANPQVATRFEKLSEQNPSYLAHEYFNRDWEPMHFATMAEWLEPAKLSFACSANLVDHVPALNSSGEQLALLREISDPNFKETVRDMMINQQFRRDYWIKGAQPVNSYIKAESLRAMRFVLIQPRSEVSLKVTGAIGEGDMHASFYTPLLDLLADHVPRTIDYLEKKIAAVLPRSLEQITEALLLLVSKNSVAVVQAESSIAKSRTATDKLNGHLLEMARGTTTISYLASPVTGGAIAIGAMEQLYILALKKGKKNNLEMATFVEEVLLAQGRRIIKDGKPIANAEEHKNELLGLVTQFIATKVPMLKALGIVG